MNIGICSYSFHHLLDAGKQDIFQYIRDCKTLGCTRLDPWNGHLPLLLEGDKTLQAGMADAAEGLLSADEERYLAEVKAAADREGLPFGCIAVDGAHIYDESPEQRAVNRTRAYRWLTAAARLGATHVRIDAGGPQEWDDAIFAVITDGYRDLTGRAQRAGIKVIVENHWGPTVIPDNVVRLLEAVPELGLLLDSWNWARGKQGEGWLKCAKYAEVTHIKTFHFTEDGQELTQNIPAFCRLLVRNGFAGGWGVESTPADRNEMDAARKTIRLIRESLERG